jgi:putative oxidoreductase
MPRRENRIQVRRLYSTFASGTPGIGLLLLRLVLGAALIVRATPHLWLEAPVPVALASAVLATSGLLLLAGFWTPMAGAIVVLIEAARLVHLDDDPMVGLLAAGIGGGLALLGPGHWSIDARVFGWKRIDTPTRTR